MLLTTLQDFVAYEIMSDITDKARVKLQTTIAPDGMLLAHRSRNKLLITPFRKAVRIAMGQPRVRELAGEQILLT